MDSAKLLRGAPPTALVTATEWREIVTLEIEAHDKHDTTWTTLRGAKMRTLGGFFDELAAAMQFPIWFGSNWDALIDMARERVWLAGRVFAIYDAHLLLADASDLDRKNFADVMTLCNRSGGEVDLDEGGDDGFHVLCQVRTPDRAAFDARWTPTKLSLGDL
jgi:hypothetical protein